MERTRSLAALIGLANFAFIAIPATEAAQFTNGGNLPYGGSVCMDVLNGATEPSTPVQVWTCHGWLNQQWSMQGFTIYGIGSTGRRQNCLDVAGARTAAGTNVNLYPCNGTVAQQWYFYNGRLYNPNSNKCLDAGNRANGTRLVINFCSTSASQQWQIK